MNTTREAFEAWATAEPREWDIYRWGDHCAHSGKYFDDNVQCAWEAWQAACAAEREACAQVCQERAEKFEGAAQRADARGAHDDAVSYRATARQLTVCASAAERKESAMNNEEIRKIALAHGFRDRPQPDGTTPARTAGAQGE